MRSEIPSPQYSLVSQGFHWLIAILIFAAIALGLGAEQMPNSPQKITVFILHKSIGITVLVLFFARLAWRVVSTPPKLLGLAPTEQRLASFGHWALYGLMLAVPLSGYLLNSAAGYPFAWFNLFSVPNIPWVGESLKAFFKSAHWVLYYCLLFAVIGHVSMLVVHRFKHQLNLLPRMLPFGSYGFGAIILAVGVAVVVYLLSFTWVESQDDSVTPVTIVESPTTMAAQSTSPGFTASAEASFLKFQGAYSGEPFDGEFRSFSPLFYFAPEQPEQGTIEVTVDTASVTTFNSDWDSSLSGGEWFAVADYPQARFYTDDISVGENEDFIANGTLTLKGQTKPQSVRFTWQSQEEGTILFTGTAIIDRREYGIGSGMWANDPTIGFEVKLDIELLLSPLQ
jgi:cytochrome b561/polyisoprenoid-binding protein YceI